MGYRRDWIKTVENYLDHNPESEVVVEGRVIEVYSNQTFSLQEVVIEGADGGKIIAHFGSPSLEIRLEGFITVNARLLGHGGDGIRHLKVINILKISPSAQGYSGIGMHKLHPYVPSKTSEELAKELSKTLMNLPTERLSQRSDMKIKKCFHGERFEDIYVDILRELCYNPEFMPHTRGNNAREIINLSFELSNPYDRIVWNKVRATNYDFAIRFFIWMLNGDSDFSYVADVNPNAKNYIDDSKRKDESTAKFSTAYGPRIARQMDVVIEELKRDPGTRRAVISILHEDDLKMLGTNTKDEFPCTESVSFFVRDNKLNVHVKMRSNNMVTTLVYDVFNFTMLQEYVLNRLNHVAGTSYKMGTYYHNCGSAHYFSDQHEFVEKIISTDEPFMVRKK